MSEKSNINNIEIDNSEIFIKKSDLPKQEKKLCYHTIINSIPEPYYKESKYELKSIAVEWRWRFYKINNKTHVEMSFTEPNSNKRSYLNKNEEYITYDIDIDKEYKKYLIDEYYFYTKKESS